ncbi:MAG: hypothetical protein ACRD1E_13260 [Terriglobales bacterium]
MTGAGPRAAAPRQWGRLVLGAGAVCVGGVDLFWRQPGGWLRTEPLNHLPVNLVLALFLLVAAVELAGGVALIGAGPRAVLAPAPAGRAIRAGALALTGAYLVVTALTLPGIFRHPLIFNSCGYTGEELSRLAGAVIAFAMAAPPPAGARSARLALAAFCAFGACVATFMGEQLAFFARTVTLVPTWIPPSPWFWTVATTVAFGLAAAALLVDTPLLTWVAPYGRSESWLRSPATGARSARGASKLPRSGRMALLAARLLTAMMVAFAVLVWVPILVAQPHLLSNWLEGAETLSIAGAAWVVADYLAAH